MSEPVAVAFFGCWERAGHFLYDQTGKTLPSFGPFIPESLDGVLLRKGWRIPGQVDITCFKDYTVIAFEDNSIDRRPGSNAAFIVEGYAKTRKECWSEAERGFPQIVNRVRSHVRIEDH
jgi:hypothetical protein